MCVSCFVVITIIHHYSGDVCILCKICYLIIYSFEVIDIHFNETNEYLKSAVS